MDFVAIDFETAHANHACEIGLSIVENGLITRSKSWLIKPYCFPYMNPWNQRVHGISTADVANAPTFDELWIEIKPWIEDKTLVAHNAAFDMKVLRSLLQQYDLAVPYTDYFCSVSLSRKVWKNLKSHSLGNLCEFHDIRFQHHRAGDDAQACAQIVLLAFRAASVQILNEGLSDLGVTVKRL